MSDARLEAHKGLAQRFVNELWNAQRLDVADEIFSSDCVPHTYGLDSGSAPERRGPRHVKAIVENWRQAFPDWQIAITDLLAEDDRVMLLTTATGTHRGTLMGIPATGKRVTFTGMRVFRIADGRIAEYWVMWDWLGLWRQIGIMPDRERLYGAAGVAVRAVGRALGITSGAAARALRSAARALQTLESWQAAPRGTQLPMPAKEALSG
ncbi:MAG TPA: ester cyclase [Chloroflexota bacterium]|nr:ester cyclase [Chloroflexota bacterium]